MASDTDRQTVVALASHHKTLTPIIAYFPEDYGARREALCKLTGIKLSELHHSTLKMLDILLNFQIKGKVHLFYQKKEEEFLVHPLAKESIVNLERYKKQQPVKHETRWAEVRLDFNLQALNNLSDMADNMQMTKSAIIILAFDVFERISRFLEEGTLTLSLDGEHFTVNIPFNSE